MHVAWHEDVGPQIKLMLFSAGDNGIYEIHANSFCGKERFIVVTTKS